MYNSYFGFRESPFSISPDPRFFYANSVYLEAYASLRYGIEAKKGFVAVIGEVGTGKTTLLRKLMRQLKNTTHSVLVFNAALTFDELLRVILADLALPVDGKNKLGMIEQLNRYLIEQFEKGHIVCVLIDEAQSLSDQSLEGLRLLSNLETDRQKLLQIVLAGQPELDARLEQPNLRQLKQRIAIRCEIRPLSHDEVDAYIKFRLNAAGHAGEVLFDPQAIQKIASYSKGIPRLINILCDGALLLAYAASKKRVLSEMIGEVASDLRLHSSIPPTTATPANEKRGMSSIAGRTLRPARKAARSAVTFGAVFLAGVLAFAILSFFARQAFLTPGMTTVAPNQRNLQSRTINAQNTNPLPSTKGRTLILRYGSTISHIATEIYGDNAALGMELIKESNPEIKNLDVVSTGQQLVLPQITKEILIRQQPDNSYRVILGSFLNRRAAEVAARHMLTINHAVVITANQVSANLVLFRLEVDGLQSRQEAVRAVETAIQSGWLKLRSQSSPG
jgi:general secretion pathway protein A